MKPILVAGCLRSGFAWTTSLLQAAGLDICHESLDGKDGVVAWWVGHRYKDEVEAKYPGAIVLHQVRHPLDSIVSMEPRMAKHYMRDITHPTDSLIVRAAKLWVHLNVYAEYSLRPLMTYRVEQINCKWPRVNTSEHDRLTWDDLQGRIKPNLFNTIQEMASRYGYI